jgi:hypothetical protein
MAVRIVLQADHPGMFMPVAIVFAIVVALLVALGIARAGCAGGRGGFMDNLAFNATGGEEREADKGGCS